MGLCLYLHGHWGRIIEINAKKLRLHSIFTDIPNFSGVFYVPLHQNSRKMDKELINRIKVVLAEKNLTNKWLAEQLDKDQGTVSKWATNTSQPDLKTLIQIAKCLNVGVQDLLREPVQNDNVKVVNR